MNAYTLAGLPAAVLSACYLIAGEFWIAFGIAAAVAIVALGVTLADTLQRLAEAHAELARRDREADVVRLPLGSAPMRREVPPQRTGEHDDDLPEADESWLAETPLFHDGEGRWV